MSDCERSGRDQRASPEKMGFIFAIAPDACILGLAEGRGKMMSTPTVCIQRPVEKLVILYKGTFKEAKILRSAYPKRIDLEYSGRGNFTGNLQLKDRAGTYLTLVTPKHHILVERDGTWVTILHENFDRDFDLRLHADPGHLLNEEFESALERQERIDTAAVINQSKTLKKFNFGD